MCNVCVTGPTAQLNTQYCFTTGLLECLIQQGSYCRTEKAEKELPISTIVLSRDSRVIFFPFFFHLFFCRDSRVKLSLSAYIYTWVKLSLCIYIYVYIYEYTYIYIYMYIYYYKVLLLVFTTCIYSGFAQLFRCE